MKKMPKMDVEDLANIEDEIFDDTSEESIMNNITQLSKIKSPLKWAGGKSRILNNIFTYVPKDTTRLIEPFFGGGSVGLNINCPEIIINDSNEILMNFWESIQSNSDKFIEEVSKIFIGENNTSSKFYELRTEFNSTTDTFRKSVLFLYLNKHCFNGLCRFNSKGEFNVPFGKYKSINAPIDEIKNVSKRIIFYTLLNKDFRHVFELVEEGTVVYCDPPYVPLSKTANFSDYGKEGFT